MEQPEIRSDLAGLPLQANIIVITARAKEEEPALTTLISNRRLAEDPDISRIVSSANLREIPVKIVGGKDSFSAIELHTDIRVTQVLGASEDEQVLEFIGKESFLAEPFSGKMVQIVGLPGTRLDLSPLFSKGQRLLFLGRYWQPARDKDAILVVTKDALEIFNVKTGAWPMPQSGHK
jgi:hypothetical protein